MADVTSLLDTISSFGVAGLVIASWWKGLLERRVDADARVLAAVSEAEARKGAEIATLRGDVEQLTSELTLTQERMDAVVADRDAWRMAHREEVEARRAAETATKNLMETSQISLALLQALKDTVADRRHEQHDRRVGDRRDGA